MDLTKEDISKLLKFLSSEEGRKYEGSKDLAKSLNNMLTRTDDNINNTNNMSSTNDSVMPDKKSLDMLKNTMTGSPKDYLIRAAGSIASNIAGYAAKRAENSNLLAQAILEGNRDHTPEQDRIYGYSTVDKANKQWLGERTRRNNNNAAVAKAVQNVINDTFGLYSKRDDALRMMQAQQLLGAPGNFYNYLGTSERINERARRATGD